MIDSPVQARKGESPLPKVAVSSYLRYKTVKIRQDPMTPLSYQSNAGDLTNKVM